MGVLKYSTLASWISSLNTIRTNLSLTQYTDSATKADTVAKASAVNNYLNSINNLRSNKYGAYGVYAISNPESVSGVIDDNIITKIDTTLSDLAHICANDLTRLTSTSGFSLENIQTSFSVTSFTRTLVAANTNFVNQSNNGNCTTNFSPDFCDHFSTNMSNELDWTPQDCMYFSDFNKNTSFATDNPYGSNFNTPMGDCNVCIDYSRTCFNFENCTTNTDFTDACSNFGNCVTNTDCSNQSNLTNFNPNTSCSNTCNKTSTVNTLTPQYSGFAVRV